MKYTIAVFSFALTFVVGTVFVGRLGLADRSASEFEVVDLKSTSLQHTHPTPIPISENLLVSFGELNSRAESLPDPIYPAAAKAVRASGKVSVSVTVSNDGDVVTASALSGHPLLRSAAERAAHKAKFAPTILSGVPVRISGVLTYDFSNLHQ